MTEVAEKLIDEDYDTDALRQDDDKNHQNSNLYQFTKDKRKYKEPKCIEQNNIYNQSN